MDVLQLKGSSRSFMRRGASPGGTERTDAPGWAQARDQAVGSVLSTGDAEHGHRFLLFLCWRATNLL